MATQKTVEERYRKLTDIEHVLLRPGMYVGSTQAHTADCWVYDEATKKMNKQSVTWNPGLQKLFDEVISNSVDHSKRAEGKHLDQIKVEIDKITGEIIVYDNGGIPVVMHKEHEMYVPTMLFAELKAGSNFDDSEDRDWVGTNGVGASLVNIFSTDFRVETCDGKNQFRQDFSKNNHERKEPKIRPGDKPHTKITFTPDYARLGCTMDEGNYLKIVKRIVDVAACNPCLKVYLNGERIHIKSFKDYVELYAEEYEFEELASGWKFGISHSDDGFQHVSFVNGSETIVGGSHVEFLRNQLCDKLKEFFKKKHKVELRPSDIYQHITIFLDAKVMNPKYDSQTKEKLINELPKQLRDDCEISDKLVKRITQSHIIQSVLDWVEAKARAKEMEDMRKLNKNIDKSNPKSVEKFHDATSKERHKTMLCLVEGDSALGGVLSGRDPKIVGAFPLRGKPINVYEMGVRDVVENKEFKNILTITGLQLGIAVNSINDVRFGKIVFTTDQDLDGFSIRGLLMNMLYKFWPELFKLGMVYILNTPLVKVKYKKDLLQFYSQEEYDVWLEKHQGEKFESKFFKGLGTSSSKEWKEYFSPDMLDQNLVQLKIETKEDDEMFKLLFSKEKGMTDERKLWLALQEEV